MQGFYINSDEDVERLGGYCKEVYIDVILGKAPVGHYQKLASFDLDLGPEMGRIRAVEAEQPRYRETTCLSEEMVTAKGIHHGMMVTIDQTMQRIAAGKRINMKQLPDAVQPMVERVQRNPDAFSWLARLENKDDYTY